MTKDKYGENSDQTGAPINESTVGRNYYNYPYEARYRRIAQSNWRAGYGENSPYIGRFGKWDPAAYGKKRRRSGFRVPRFIYMFLILATLTVIATCAANAFLPPLFSDVGDDFGSSKSGDAGNYAGGVFDDSDSDRQIIDSDGEEGAYGLGWVSAGVSEYTEVGGAAEAGGTAYGEIGYGETYGAAGEGAAVVGDSSTAAGDIDGDGAVEENVSGDTADGENALDEALEENASGETYDGISHDQTRFDAKDYGSLREEAAAIADLMLANSARSVYETTSAALAPDGSPVFIWPVEPKYAPLAHDYYLVSSGAKKVNGFTHNNGLIRDRHYVYIAGRSHYGFDITTAPGTEVRSAAVGVVVTASESYDERSKTSDYGKYVVVDHGDAIGGIRTYTVYAHLSSQYVRSGDFVRKGDVIGLSGSTGGSRIPHVHFEVRAGENSHGANINPLEVLPAKDLGKLSDRPSVEAGFPASSVELYNRMTASDWGYDVHVKSLVNKSSGADQAPAGVRLRLLSRSDSSGVVLAELNGVEYQYAISELEYEY